VKELNMKDILPLVELYKQGKVTKYSLEAELTNAIELITHPISTDIRILGALSDKVINAFGVAILPSISQSKTTVTLFIDDSLIVNILTEEEVLKLIVSQCLSIQDVTRIYSKFLISKSNMNVTVEDCLQMFLDINQVSLSAIREKFPQINAKLLSSNLISDTKVFDTEKAKIDSFEEKLEQIIERLLITDHFPSVFVDASKELAAKMCNLFGSDVEEKGYDDKEGTYNSSNTHIKKLVDGTYENLGKIISYTYKPDTN